MATSTTSTTLVSLLPVIVVVLIQCGVGVVDSFFVAPQQQYSYHRHHYYLQVLVPTSTSRSLSRSTNTQQNYHLHNRRQGYSTAQRMNRHQHRSQITIQSNLQENPNDHLLSTTNVNNDNNDSHEGHDERLEGEEEREEILPLSVETPLQFPNLCIIGICGSIGSGKSYTCSLLVSKLNSLLSSPSASPSSSSPQTSNDGEIDTDEINKTEHRQQQEEEGGKDEDQVAFHIDTDSLAHGVYKPGSLALKQIEQEFGSSVIQDDGSVDRKVLGGIVFNDEAQMAKLEQIVWPHVKTILLERLNQIEKMNKVSSTSPTITTKRRIVVVEAAVLLDANWDDNELFDAIWVVRSSSQVSAERLVSKRGMDKVDALKRMEAQLSRRGIGNLDQELLNGSVTAVIQNDGGTTCIETDADTDSRGKNGNGVEIRGDGSELWNSIQRCLTDPTSWKDGRCPKVEIEKLLDSSET